MEVKVTHGYWTRKVTETSIKMAKGSAAADLCNEMGLSFKDVTMMVDGKVVISPNYLIKEGVSVSINEPRCPRR